MEILQLIDALRARGVREFSCEAFEVTFSDAALRPQAPPPADRPAPPVDRTAKRMELDLASAVDQ